MADRKTLTIVEQEFTIPVSPSLDAWIRDVAGVPTLHVQWPNDPRGFVEVALAPKPTAFMVDEPELAVKEVGHTAVTFTKTSDGKFTKLQLNTMNVRQLREVAKALGVTYPSSMHKADIIAKLIKAQK